MTPIQLRSYCILLYERKKGDVVLVCPGNDGRIQYALRSAVEDMRTLSWEMNKRLHRKGGGSVLVAQGTQETTWQEAENTCRGRG